MHRAIRTNNRICFDKNLKRNWKIHQQKVRNIQSSINHCRPKQFVFLDQRAKRLALQEVKNIEIEKENQCLLDKIKSMDRKVLLLKKRNKSENSIKKKTLNENFRKRENEKIVEQNQGLTKRIFMKKSAYNVKKWVEERKLVQKNINLISEYPYKNYQPTHTKVNFWMTQENLLNKQSQGKLKDNSRIQKAINYSKIHKINGNYYLIQTKVDKKVFKIEMENLQDSSDKYKLQIQEEQIYRFLQDNFNSDIQKLIQNLQLSPKQGKCYLNTVDINY